MKTKIFAISILFVLAVFAVSCVEDGMYGGPANIEKIEISPSKITPDNDVTVTATITDLQGVTGAKIQYKVNGGTQSEVNMTGSGNTYTGVIPKQADKAVVVFTVVANNKAGVPAVSSEQSYTVGADPIDFKNLVLNEIDGVSKTIELFNKGTVAIPLEGVTLVKNNGTSAWWTGVAANGSLAPGAYLVIGQNSEDALLKGASGISNGQNLKFELKGKDGSSLGVFLRGDEGALSTAISSVNPNSFQRIPNGTGDWKLAAPTNGAVNASSGADIPQS